tara:strand:- start:218 stop:565 length:348 start_codon:yes stop_codon:yes gene_type:complete
MNHYESTFILNPALSEAQVNDLIKKYQSFLKDNGCKIIDIENWGLKKLAYSIQNKLSGFYALIDFEYGGDENIINIYETELKRDERVMRYLNVKLDKYATEWSVKRRSRMKKEKV